MNKITKCLILSACIMIGLPWLAVTLIGSSGMAAVFILFFVVGPVFSVLNGIFGRGKLQEVLVDDGDSRGILPAWDMDLL